MRQVFERLKQAGDPENVKAKAEALKARDEEQFLRAQKRLTELVCSSTVKKRFYWSHKIYRFLETRRSR